MGTRVLLTGGCGFVGHHMAEHILKTTDWHIVVLDHLNYASSGIDRLRDIQVFDDNRVSLLTTDFTQKFSEGIIKEIGDVEYIFHLGADTHVDRSIDDPEPFVKANVIGTMHVLNFARQLRNLKRLFYFSTDEVFGPAPNGVAYKEWDRYNSGNPYAATKAGGEELCLAYGNTYKLPVIITHCMNIFGERQHPEKFIPLCIRKIQSGEKILIHSDQTKQIPGSRVGKGGMGDGRFAPGLFGFKSVKSAQGYPVLCGRCDGSEVPEGSDAGRVRCRLSHGGFGGPPAA